VHAHPELPFDGPGQGGWPEGGIGCQLCLGPGEDLAGELVAAAGPGLGRHQPVQPGFGQGGGCLVLPGAENSDEGGARDTNEEPDNSGGLVGEVPGYVGEVPVWGAAKSLP
jgi:hypothetical protein